MGQGKEGLGEDVDKSNREDNTGTKVLSELDGESGAAAVTDEHGEDTTKTGNDREDEKGNNMVPDDVLAVVVVVGLTCAIGSAMKSWMEGWDVRVRIWAFFSLISFFT